MFRVSSMASLVSAAFFIAAACPAVAQQVKRTELKRADLTGTNMEVITAIVEAPPGVTIPRHFHHGEESFYVIQGGMLQLADGKHAELKTGSAGINAREVPHAGFTIVGNTPLILFTTHIVDKGRPLNVLVNQ